MNLDKHDFHVNKFLGCGCYSLVYEVQKISPPDTGNKYALKKFFLLNQSSIKCVLREREILVKLSENSESSPFLPKLFYSLWIPFSPIFIITESCGKDLYDLIQSKGCIQEDEARFYISQIICGLELVHKIGIVHLDIKPENILLHETGDIFIADFDRSYNLESQKNKKPDDDDFTGTPLFMAPEIARGQVITIKADIWSLGVVLAELISGPIRKTTQNTEENFRLAREGRWNIKNLGKFSKATQSFLKNCLHSNYKERPTIEMLKSRIYLKSVDWEKVKKREIVPPFKSTEITHRPTKRDKKLLESQDQDLLNDAFSKTPSYNYQSKKLNSSTKPDLVGITDEDLEHMFKEFPFKYRINK